MSYSRKIRNRPDLDLFYTYGNSQNFEKFKGKMSWRLNKGMENFSNDTYFEADGELRDGSFHQEYFGLGKRHWRFNEDGIGVRK